MDLYNIITKIPYIIMLIAGLIVILGLYIGGLNNLSMEIDDSSQENYRKAIVLENMLNIEASDSEISATANQDYTYARKRAQIPIEFFTNKDPDYDEIGFKQNQQHCYIEGVTGLDGSKFAFGIESIEYDDSRQDPALTHFSFDCFSMRSNSATSPILLIRKGEDKPPVEVILHVYPI